MVVGLIAFSRFSYKRKMLALRIARWTCTRAREIIEEFPPSGTFSDGSLVGAWVEAFVEAAEQVGTN
jgi:hypothetical protein